MAPTGSPDPIGEVLAWLFIVLAIFAAIVAIVPPSTIVLLLEGLAKVKHRPSPPLEPQPSAE